MKQSYDVSAEEETKFSQLDNIRQLRDDELLEFLTHDQTVIEIRHGEEIYGAIRGPTRAHIVRPRLSHDSGRLSFRLDVSGGRIDPENTHTDTITDAD